MTDYHRKTVEYEAKKMADHKKGLQASRKLMQMANEMIANGEAVDLKEAHDKLYELQPELWHEANFTGRKVRASCDRLATYNL